MNQPLEQEEYFNEDPLITKGLRFFKKNIFFIILVSSSVHFKGQISPVPFVEKIREEAQDPVTHLKLGLPTNYKRTVVEHKLMLTNFWVAVTATEKRRHQVRLKFSMVKKKQ